MANVTLRGLLAKLTALALSAGTAAAAPQPVAAPDLDSDEDLAATTWIDPGRATRREAAQLLGHRLARALSEMRALPATQLAASWSLSPDPLRRHAVAYALEWRFPLVGDGLAIDHLSRDEDPAIRAASARAAWARRASGGDAGVLDRLAADPDPDVRAVASSARR